MTTHSANETLRIIQRGIAGHLTFVAAVRGWGTSFELSLYPPIGSILAAREWVPHCQFQLPRPKGTQGAPRTIDFVAHAIRNPELQVAIEVKLLPSGGRANRVSVENDIDKLREFKSLNKNSNAYLLIVGRKADINKSYIAVDGKRMDLCTRLPIIADVGRTALGSVVVKI